MRDELLLKAKYAANLAQKAGADDARAYVQRSREVRVEMRDGKLDRIRESTRQGLYITLFVNGRYSSNSTSDVRDEAVADFVQQLVEGSVGPELDLEPAQGVSGGNRVTRACIGHVNFQFFLLDP